MQERRCLSDSVLDELVAQGIACRRELLLGEDAGVGSDALGRLPTACDQVVALTLRGREQVGAHLLARARELGEVARARRTLRDDGAALARLVTEKVLGRPV